MIYLDNAATTQIAPEVLDAMLPYLKDNFGNPGSNYSLGRAAREGVEKARRQVADFLGCEPEQIVFTSGGSEANTTAILGIARRLSEFGLTHVICSKTEHKSALKAVHALTKSGFDATYICGSDSGCITERTVQEALRPETGLVVAMHTNNETGVCNNIEELSTLCREKNIRLHVDAVQAAGFYDLNMSGVEMAGVGTLSVSAHKIHGPKGVGTLFVRNPKSLDPLVFGGDQQEFGLRGGTENVAGIVGFGTACEIARKDMKETATKISLIRQRFFLTLREELGEHRNILSTNGASAMDRGRILNVRFDGVDAETLLMVLDANEVLASAGSACNSVEHKPSHVLTAIGLTPEQARSSVRFSFAKNTSEDDAIFAATKVADCVKSLLRLGVAFEIGADCSE